MKNGKTIYKYNKITQQKKFHLLTLVLDQKLLIKDAAKIVGINYSTAKTILFFNRNGDKSYQFDFNGLKKEDVTTSRAQASFLDLSVKWQDGQNLSPIYSPIHVISTVGSKKEQVQLSSSSKSSFSLTQDFNRFQKKFIGKKWSDGKKGEEDSQGQKIGMFQSNLQRRITRAQVARLRQIMDNKLQQQLQQVASETIKPIHLKVEHYSDE